MNKKILIALLVVLVLVSACGERIHDRLNDDQTPSEDNSDIAPDDNIGTDTPVETGDSTGSLSVDGVKRSYLLHIPKNYDPSKKYPLIVVFHGGSQTNTEIAKLTGFSELSETEGFLVVYPQGIEKNWDDGRGATDASKAGADDVSFIRDLVSELEGAYAVDKSRVYATGTSNGGIMTHRMGCELSDVFAAIAPVIGSLAENLESSCNPSPISVMVIQGTADPFIDINGGEVKHKKFSSLGDGGFVISAESARKLWASKDGCASTPKTEELPIRVNDGTSVTKISYANCKANTEVVYYIVNGMGHTYPPKVPEIGGNIVGSSSQNIDATQEAWKFFKRHAK